jgi:lipid II:glycine glycyltransferase (peptidoglycan interpeptide bridge formation enzyme)
MNSNREQKEILTEKNNYTVEIDQVTEVVWHDMISLFRDASIFQTWSYGKIRWGNENLSHLILKRDKKIVAAAQIRIFTLPLLQRGIAYISWGPMWRLWNENEDFEALSVLLEHLTQEYGLKRRLYLRVRTNCFIEFDNAQRIESIYEAHGFFQRKPWYRTILVDLDHSLEMILKNLKGSWRRNLRKSEQNSLSLAEGRGNDSFDRFNQLHDQMLRRKRLRSALNGYEYQKIQQDLPEHLKMDVMLVNKNDNTIAAIVISNIGDTAIYLLGATGDEGLQTRGSYHLHWKMIEKLHTTNARYYDLFGYSPHTHPGTAQFKAGFNGLDVSHMGEFEWCTNPLSKMSVKTGDQIQNLSQKINKLLEGK